MDGEECYQSYNLLIERLNHLIEKIWIDGEEEREKKRENIKEEGRGQEERRVGKGELINVRENVVFGSELFGFGFTLSQFAELYSKKVGVRKEKFLSKLWGDNFFDPRTKKWVKKEFNNNGKRLKRGWSQFIFAPLQLFFDYIFLNIDWKKDGYERMISNLEIELTREEKNFTGKKLLKVVLQKFLPLSSALFPMIASHSPSPLLAQQNRIQNLYYVGDERDKIWKGIRDCDPNGPLIVYLSETIHDSFHSSFAFGRVFSGRLVPGQQIYFLKNEEGEKKKENESVREIVVTSGRFKEKVNDCCCGNVIGLVGLAQFSVGPETISTEEKGSQIQVRFDHPWPLKE